MAQSQELIRWHNERTLKSLEVGDMVEFKRGIYSHWAVYIGEDEVVHLAGDDSDGLVDNVNQKHLFTICGQSFDKAYVKRDSFWTVAGDSKAFKNNTKDVKLQPKEPQEIRENALSKLGKIGYNILYKNCEHFAAWCRYQVEKSDQVESFLTVAGLLGAGAAVLGIAYGMSKSSKEKKEREEPVPQ